MLRIAFLAATIATAASVTPAAAQNINQTWRGSLLITNASAACDSDPHTQKGTTYLAVYRPKLSASQSNSSLLITAPNGALLGTANNPGSINGGYTGVLLSNVATVVEYTGGSYNFTLTPSNVTASTPQVTITGTITRAANVAGCTITIKGSFFRGV